MRYVAMVLVWGVAVGSNAKLAVSQTSDTMAGAMAGTMNNQPVIESTITAWWIALFVAFGFTLRSQRKRGPQHMVVDRPTWLR